MRKLLFTILISTLTTVSLASGCYSYDRAVEKYNSLTNYYNQLAGAYNAQLDAYDDEVYIKVATFKMDDILGGLEKPELRKFLRSMTAIQGVFETAVMKLEDIRDDLGSIEHDDLFDISGSCKGDAKRLIRNKIVPLSNMAYELSEKYDLLYDKYDEDIESLNELL